MSSYEQPNKREGEMCAGEKMHGGKEAGIR